MERLKSYYFYPFLFIHTIFLQTGSVYAQQRRYIAEKSRAAPGPSSHGLASAPLRDAKPTLQAHAGKRFSDLSRSEYHHFESLARGNFFGGI